MSTCTLVVAEAFVAQVSAIGLLTSELSPIVTSVPLVTASQDPPVDVTVHVNVVLPVRDAESVAVTVTEDVPVAVGVPLTRPEELIDRPAGRPVAENVYGAVPPLA